MHDRPFKWYKRFAWTHDLRFLKLFFPNETLKGVLPFSVFLRKTELLRENLVSL